MLVLWVVKGLGRETGLTSVIEWSDGGRQCEYQVEAWKVRSGVGALQVGAATRGRVAAAWLVHDSVLSSEEVRSWREVIPSLL